MNQSMNRFINVGTIAFMSYPSIMKGEGPIEEVIKKIATDDYFNLIELTWIKDPETRKRVSKMLRESRLQVFYGAQPRLLTTGLNINDINEEKRQKALQSMIEGIDEAVELGAKSFAFLSGKYEEVTKNESYAALLDSTFKICEYAKGKGIKVALEVFDFDVDKKSIIGPCELAKKFAEDIKVKYDNFGLLVDLSHMPLVREKSKDTLQKLKEHIVHVHIGNAVIKEGCAAFGDAHPRFGFENGENDVEELKDYLEGLFDIGYLSDKAPGYISFEVKPWEDEDSDVILTHSKRTLNEAWSKL